MKIEFKFNEKLNRNELIIERWGSYGGSKKLLVFGEFDHVNVLEETGEFIDCLDKVNNKLRFSSVSYTTPWNYSVNLAKNEIFICWSLIKDLAKGKRRVSRSLLPEIKILDKAIISVDSKITGIRICTADEIVDIDYINNTISSEKYTSKMKKEENDINSCKDIINDIISKIEYNYEKLYKNNYIQERFSSSLFEKSLRLEKDPIQNCIIYFNISNEISSLHSFMRRLHEDARDVISEYLEKSYKDLLIRKDHKNVI